MCLQTKVNNNNNNNNNNKTRIGVLTCGKVEITKPLIVLIRNNFTYNTRIFPNTDLVKNSYLIIMAYNERLI